MRPCSHGSLEPTSSDTKQALELASCLEPDCHWPRRLCMRAQTTPVGFRSPMRYARTRPADALADNHADIVLGYPDQASAELRRRASEVLDDSERVRAERFAFDRDRDLFIFSHGLLRLTLAHYVGADARELRFTTSPLGRPELDTGGMMPIRFNLSHTDGLVGCIVARSADCGIDVERLDRMDYRD